MQDIEPCKTPSHDHPGLSSCRSLLCLQGLFLVIGSLWLDLSIRWPKLNLDSLLRECQWPNHIRCPCHSMAEIMSPPPKVGLLDTAFVVVRRSQVHHAQDISPHLHSTETMLKHWQSLVRCMVMWGAGRQALRKISPLIFSPTRHMSDRRSRPQGCQTCLL